MNIALFTAGYIICLANFKNIFNNNMELNSKKILWELKKKKKDIRKYGVKKIGLFGSFAKNKQNKKSDIDFLIEFIHRCGEAIAKGR